MAYLMKCSKCGVVGELDDFMPEFDCPSCGGVMYPAAAEKKNTSTMSISRSQVESYKKVKVARAVNVGFSDLAPTIGSKTGMIAPAAPAAAAKPAPAQTAAPAKKPAATVSGGKKFVAPAKKKVVFNKTL